MRANIRTEVTLDTIFRIPFRNIYRDTTFFVSSGSLRECTVSHIYERGYREIVSFLSINRDLDIVNEINNIF
ncbi:Uncharacterised protein [uncultured Clostridium sp.]|nr:Uncharacterised protein [uncultured Clostridium sp.]